MTPPIPKKSILKRILRDYHNHLLIAIILTFVLSWSWGALAGFISHDIIVHTFGRGALYDRNKHVVPKPTLVAAGRLEAGSVNLAAYLPPVGNQYSTNSCLAWALTEADRTERAARGEAVPAESLSGFFTYAWLFTNGPTSVDAEAQSIEQHGLVPLSWASQPGYPSQYAISHAVGRNGSVNYLFYQPSGWAGVYAIRAALNEGFAPVLLMHLYSSIWGQQGWTTSNYGGFVGDHATVAYFDDGRGFYMLNSWGTGWGAQGRFYLRYDQVMAWVFGAVTFAPGAIAWQHVPVPVPVVHPKPRPTVHPKPRPRVVTTYRVVRAQYLRSAPRASSHRGILVRRGARVSVVGAPTPSWRVVSYKNKRGWILASNVRRG